MDKKKEEEIKCPLEYGLKIFGGKWDSKVICVLSECDKLRYGEIRAKVNSITDAALGSTLKKLTQDGIVDRIQYNEIPPKVEYSLTDKGKSVVPIIRSICSWTGVNNKEIFSYCANHNCEAENK